VAGDVHVAVYWLNDAEHQEVLEALRRARPEEISEYAGLTEGWVSKADLQTLLAQAFTVDVIDKETLALEIDDGAVARVTDSHRRASDLVRDPQHKRLSKRLEQFVDQAESAEGEETKVPVAARADEDAAVALGPASAALEIYHIQLRGRISELIRTELESLHVRVLAYEQRRWYIVAVPAANVGEVESLPFVVAMKKRSPGEVISAEFLVALDHAHEHDEQHPTQIDLTVPDSSDLQKVRQAVDDATDANVIEAAGSTIRIEAPLRSPLIPELAARPEVAMIAPYTEAELTCDHGRVLIGVASLRIGDDSLSGKGETVAVLDSGVDLDHPDLKDKVTFQDAVDGDSVDDRFGHGTHVAGIIAGSGQASAKKLCGVAPDAELAIIKVTEGPKVQLPADMSSLLGQAVATGARIINLSLGASAPTTGAVYDRYAYSTDRFVADHPDVLIIVAAGNDGNAPEGAPGFATLSSPGTAKNVLTVGASLTDRTDLDDTWGQRNPRVFKLPPVAEEPVAGDAALPAANSGRGPGSFGLIKPELLAPGTYILSARAQHISGNLPWRDYLEYDNKYVFIGGSSMAAPFVAGAAALVRQYLRNRFPDQTPSAALLKAILIAATTRLPSIRAAASDADFGYPDFDQGFGRLDLSTVLPHAEGPPKRRLEVKDIANDSSAALESRAPANSMRRPIGRYVATVAEGATEPLRVVLSWTDVPATAVQNDLGLQVFGQDSSSTSGNAAHSYGRDALIDHPDLHGILWDDRNNVEQVFLPTPAAGEYEIRVVARNTISPPQGYALVVAGELEGELQSRA
jgi:serine protease AprX